MRCVQIFKSSSDFIVGFPGETKEEFEQTMNLIAQVNFDMSFSFIYSARPGTPAADMPDDVTEEEKNNVSIFYKNVSTNKRHNIAVECLAQSNVYW